MGLSVQRQEITPMWWCQLGGGRVEPAEELECSSKDEEAVGEAARRHQKRRAMRCWEGYSG